MTSQSEALIGQRQAGWHERMGEAGCGYLASESRPQHWLKKKTKTSTTVKLLILSFNPFISLSYTRTIISFGAVGKNWFPNHLSFVLCKRNRDIVQSITLTQKMKSYMRSEFSDCCSQNIERRFSHCCCCFFCFLFCFVCKQKPSVNILNKKGVPTENLPEHLLSRIYESLKPLNKQIKTPTQSLHYTLNLTTIPPLSYCPSLIFSFTW